MQTIARKRILNNANPCRIPAFFRRLLEKSSGSTLEVLKESVKESTSCKGLQMVIESTQASMDIVGNPEDFRRVGFIESVDSRTRRLKAECYLYYVMLKLSGNRCERNALFAEFIGEVAWAVREGGEKLQNLLRNINGHPAWRSSREFIESLQVKPPVIARLVQRILGCYRESRKSGIKSDFLLYICCLTPEHLRELENYANALARNIWTDAENIEQLLTKAGATIDERLNNESLP